MTYDRDPCMDNVVGFFLLYDLSVCRFDWVENYLKSPNCVDYVEVGWEDLFEETP